MRRGLRWLAIATIALALAAGVFLVPTIWGRPWSIDQFYTRVFLEALLRHPMLLTQLRVLEPYGIRSHNRKLDDFSVAFQREEAEAVRANLRMLRSYDPASQSDAQRFSSAVLDWFLQIQVDREPFLFHDYPLNQLDGVQVELPDFMINVHPMYDARDAEDYVARLAAFGVAIDQTLDGVRFRAARGIVPPRFVIERVRDQVETFRRGGAAENVLLTSFVERVGALDSIAPEARAQLIDSVRRQLEETVLPAWERIAAYLPELEAQAGDDVGAWKHPDGSLYYGWALRNHTTTTRSADEIHALGLAEVERIHGEIREILAELEPAAAATPPAAEAPAAALPETEVLVEAFAADAPEDETAGAVETSADEASLGESLRALQRDPRFLPRTDAGRAEVLADYQAILADVEPRLPALFGRLPTAPVRVERVPAFKEAGAPGAYYMPPPLDGSRPGVFYANLRSVREVPRFGMRTLTYHESLPGHHLQIALAQELPGLPIFRRVIPFTAYVEGWALYAERVALEQGFHPTPHDRLGALIAEVFRAARLVVDTGLHARRWTREQAIDYMLANTGMPETDVVAEVERYIVMPGQACAYKIGQLEILAQREKAQQERGADFDLRAFHDAVLGSGALPLELLDESMARWSAAGPTGAASR